MGRKRKGLASKSWPEPIGGAACARRLSYSRAPYFYCPHPARHPQVPKSPETLRASGHRVQRLSRQDAGAEASFCLFWPRATTSVRGRRRAGGVGRRLGHSQVSALRPLCPVPSPVPPGGGRTRNAASQSAGGTRRLPPPGAEGGKGGTPAAQSPRSRLRRARPPSVSPVAGCCKASWEVALAPKGRACARRQRRWRRRGYKRE